MRLLLSRLGVSAEVLTAKDTNIQCCPREGCSAEVPLLGKSTLDTVTMHGQKSFADTFAGHRQKVLHLFASVQHC
jgi:hypothetical protein